MLAGVLLHDILARRASTDGSGPFLTCYVSAPEARPDRTELSARSFANWVAKTANLLTDEIGLDPGDRVELRLAADHPGHWMTLIWVMAAWQAGLTVTDRNGDVVVDGPRPPASTPTVPAYAASLHPLGLGLRDLPPGWLDFSSAALAQPDDWFGEGPEDADAVAWEVAGVERSFAELTSVTPSARRGLVVDPRSAWDAVQECLAAPLLGGGSSVVAIGVDETTRARIAVDEKVEP